MPNISEAGTYTKENADFGFLRGTNQNMPLLFAGDSTGSGPILVQYTDDRGVDRTLENGEITALPASIIVASLNRDIKIVVSGTPVNLNVSGG